MSSIIAYFRNLFGIYSEDLNAPVSMEIEISEQEIKTHNLPKDYKINLDIIGYYCDWRMIKGGVYDCAVKFRIMDLCKKNEKFPEYFEGKIIDHDIPSMNLKYKVEIIDCENHEKIKYKVTFTR